MFYRRLKVIIPCKNCAGVAYCTTFCRDEAADSYHKYECEFQEVLTGLGCSQISRLALRMITINPFKYYLISRYGYCHAVNFDRLKYHGRDCFCVKSLISYWHGWQTYFFVLTRLC